jgi:hypothetical protein
MNLTPIPSSADTRVTLSTSEDESLASAHEQTIELGDIINLTNILFAVQNGQQESQASEQEAAIRAQAQQIRLAMDRVREAAEQARESAEKSSLWGDIASTAKVVAAVATVVAGVAGAIASGGLSVVGTLAIAGALISIGSKPIAEAVADGDKTAEMLIGIGGGALALGGGLATASAGAQAASSAGAGASALRSVASSVRIAACVVQAAALGVEGYAGARAGSAQADGIDAQADGIDARAHQRISQEQLDELIRALKDLDESFARAKSSLLEAQNEVGNTNNMLAATLGR